MKLEQFILDNPNKEKLIITDDVFNVQKLLKTISDEISVIGNLKIVGLNDLVKEINVNEKAKNNDYNFETVIDSSMAGYLVGKLINEGNYHFIPKECLCDDIYLETYQYLNVLRSGYVTSEYLNCDNEKINELKQLICDYENRLSEKNLVDNVLLLKRACYSNEVFNGNSVIGSLFFRDLTYLEKSLVNKYYGSIIELDYEFNERNENFWQCFGVNNEVNLVVDKIINEKLAFDDVNILFSNEVYRKLLKTRLSEAGIPFTLAYRALDCNFIQMLKVILYWAANDYQYAYLEKLVLNEKFVIEGQDSYEAFVRGLKANIFFGLERYNLDSKYLSDSFSAMLKRLAATFKVYEGRDVLVCSFIADLINFLKDYSCCPKKEIEAVEYLAERCRVLDIELKYEEAIIYLLEQLDKLSINESEEEGKVNCIAFRNKVEVLERKHNFVLGLADSHFTGDSIESNILTDNELRLYLDLSKGFVPLAKENELRHKNICDKTISSLKDGYIDYCYSNFDPLSDSGLSASAYFLAISNGKKINEYSSYPNTLNGNYINNITKIEEGKEEVNEAHVYCSASKLDLLLGCPLEYFYKYEMKYDEIEYEELDKAAWLNPICRGNLVHYVLEKYIKHIFIENNLYGSDLDEKYFDELFENEVKLMVAERPYPNVEIYKIEKREIYKALKAYLINLHKEYGLGKWKAYKCEMKIDSNRSVYKHVYEDGKVLHLHLEGIIDRIDFDGTNYRIIDYKSGKYKSKSEEVKKVTTTQHILYQMAVSLFGNVESFTFVFPFEKYHKELRIDSFEQLPDKVWDKLRAVFLDYDYTVSKCGNPYCKLKKYCRLNTAGEKEDE